LAWLLVGLAQASLGRRLIFKGGTALKRCYFGDYRFSEDLDFTLVAEVTFGVLLEDLNALFAIVQSASGILFRFLRQDSDAHINSYTFYITYEGPLATSGTGRQVKVDITLREHLVYPVVQRPVLRGYEEYTDLPEGPTISTYSLNEIGAEKVVAVTDPARNEPRDLYDLWYLAGGPYIEVAAMSSAVEQKWAFRGKNLTDIQGVFRAKEMRYRALWEKRLGMQVATLPEFDTVYRAVQRVLRRAGLT
jgi:predicted nucleotidyltransferase component of viral defense system